jgi:hypothetical protein
MISAVRPYLALTFAAQNQPKTQMIAIMILENGTKGNFQDSGSVIDLISDLSG